MSALREPHRGETSRRNTAANHVATNRVRMMRRAKDDAKNDAIRAKRSPASYRSLFNKPIYRIAGFR